MSVMQVPALHIKNPHLNIISVDISKETAVCLSSHITHISIKKSDTGADWKIAPLIAENFSDSEAPLLATDKN